MIKEFSRKKKIIVLLVFVVFISLTLAACDSPTSTNGTSPDPDPETYQLSFDYLGEGNLAELDGEYDEGSSVEISADPAEGWEFYKWEGEGIQEPDEASTSVLVSEDQEIKAIFIEEYDGDANDDGYAGWEGTEDKPYLIKNATHLDNIRNEMEAYFVLIEDINLENYNTWDPIGSYEYFEEDETEEYEGFKGVLDGRNYAINNLVIEKIEEDNDFVGLFRIIENGTIRNLDIIDADIKGDYNTGILAGINGFSDEATGKINNVKTSGEVNGIWSLGGLVGRNAGIIEKSSSYATVKVEDESEGYANIGGLVGVNSHGENSYGIIRDSYTKGEVITNNRQAGGLVGVSTNENSIIQDSYADIDISGNREVGGLIGAIHSGTEIINSHAKGNIEGSSSVGGLVGSINESKIENSYAEGNVEGKDGIGGLVGEIYESEILDSYAIGDVTGDERHVGGLAGILQDSEIDNSYATGKVFAGANHEDHDHGDAGGLVGAVYNNAIITNSHATGEVESNGFNVGGLVGQLDGNIENSYAEGDVEGKGQIGGLIGGFHKGEILDSYAKGIITGERDVGGLIGSSNGEIIRSYALGKVYGVVIDGGHFGGLVGTLNGIISKSFADVNTELLQDQDEHSVAGGLVGFVGEDGKIDNSYATGNVLSEGDKSPLGGLSGGNRGEITNSFSAGKVDEGNNNGGFSGNNDHIIEYSYYDKNTSEQNDEGKGIPKSTEEMMQLDTFESEWDFDSIWNINEGSSYPYFQWQGDDNIPEPGNI